MRPAVAAWRRVAAWSKVAQSICAISDAEARSKISTEFRRSSPCLRGIKTLSTLRPLDAVPSLTRVKGRSPYRRSYAAITAHEPTIYALSSAPGRAAIAVIRVSGKACLDIYGALCPGKKDPKPRHATVRSLYWPGKDASKENIIDSSALVFHFPAPKTVTGEDILELHVHGGPAIVKAVLAAVARCGSNSIRQIRYAEPGEFTRRAFMNNRLDLTQVEALGDTLSADTEQQRRLSVRGTSGQLAKQYEQWRQLLLYARGELEALIDFSEDQHFDESPAELCASVAAQVQVLQRALRVHSQNAVRGELLRHGISISLLGAPNGGKSSLLNRIIGREAAIVSQEAGTTRDIVEIGLDLGGYFCRFGDTAGLRQTTAATVTDSGHQPPETINRVEIEGMRRAKARAAESDIVVVVLSFEKQGPHTTILNIDPEVLAVASKLLREKDNIIVAINKSDLLAHKNSPTPEAAIAQVQQHLPNLPPDSIFTISCTDPREGATEAPGPGQSRTHAQATTHPSSDRTDADAHADADPGGIQSFLQGLIRQFGKLTAAVTGVNPPTTDTTTTDDTSSDPDASVWQESLGATERHRGLLDSCIEDLDAFLSEVAANHDDGDVEGKEAQAQAHREIDVVVAAEHLRAAAECLAKITGRGESGDVEEVLGVVFEKFCVGK